MKIKKVDIPIYYGKLIIIKYKNVEKLNKKYNQNISNRYAAVVFSDESVNYTKLIVAFHGKPSPDVIAHECAHLVNHIFINNKMGLDPYNDEPQAYLTGWFCNEIHKFFNTNK